MIHKYAEIFCWKNVSSFCSAKATHIFSAKNIRILYIESPKTVKEMTLNELVKLTMLWTTEPWTFIVHVCNDMAQWNEFDLLLQAYPGRVYKSSALIELYAYISKYSTEVSAHLSTSKNFKRQFLIFPPKDYVMEFYANYLLRRISIKHQAYLWEK